jgi:LmbE family N-acetylglucosaminyl deacetylase
MQARTYLAAALLCYCALPLAAQQIDDPANLMGERVSPPALADTLPIDHGAPALEQLLRKLRTRASMMLIVAHPDDEDSGLLTYESRGMGARVAMLTLTRGEGGQNLMTGDFNDALGLIRTQELLAEDRYTGTDQFFGTEVDFGFSKTKEEAFKQWTHERVLYDAVRAVRLYRPLVLASVFIGGVTDGHGQHQVSGEITQEVFLAAADAKVFPEMGLPPWAPLKVYARVPFAPITDKGMFDYATGKYLPPHFHNYVTGVDTTTPPQATVTIHEGEVPNIPAFEGKSYVQWARQGLALQKTQIGANFRIPPAGRVDVGYTLYGSRSGHQTAPTQNLQAPQEPLGIPSLQARDADAGPQARASAPGADSEGDRDLFTGIDTSLPALADLDPSTEALRPSLERIDRDIAAAQELLDPAHVELTAPPLRNALFALNNLLSLLEHAKIGSEQVRFNLLHELRIKQAQLDSALSLALGIQFEARLAPKAGEPPAPTLMQNYTVAVHFTNSGHVPLTMTRMEIDLNGKVAFDPTLTKERALSFERTLDLAPGQTVVHTFTGFAPDPITRPYFSRADIEQPYYDVDAPELRNAPATPDPLVGNLTLDFDGVPLLVPTTVSLPSSQSGLPAQAAVIVPELSVRVFPSLEILPPDGGQRELQVSAGIHEVSIATQLFPPKDWTSERLDPPACFSCPQHQPTEWIGHFRVTAPQLKPGSSHRITAEASGNFVQPSRESYRPVGYPGLTTTNYYTPAVAKVVAVDVTTAPHLKIAYLPGTGDSVTEFLPSLGVTPTLLSTKALTAENLEQYDAVILGVRAYSAHPELEGAGSAALNEYAKRGGVVIVQYNSAGFDPSSGPFPYIVPGDSAHNVVDEDQPVRLLAPDNPLLTWPNKITSADFNHWIEERGHGFASDWAPEYTPLLETHDPDQDPQKGGLLVARFGKGAYIYCAFALYRQLPEGVPGAYRLLANLLSYAKNPGR